MALLEADRTTGFSAGLPEVPLALGAVRRRLLEVTGQLGADEWDGPSRCDLWTVHDVVRHVRDACRIHVGRLRHETDDQLPSKGFDPRTTPRLWLERAAGESPQDTVTSLAALCRDEAEALEARLEEGGDEKLQGPH